MIVTHNITLSSVISGTWKYSIYIFLTCVAAYYLNQYFISSLFDFPPLIPSIIGTALAFFIGFNNNQAYGRWWEARIIWGAIVNDSRTWARQVMQFIPDDARNEDKTAALKTQFIHRHIAFLYALKHRLRGTQEDEFRKYLNVKDTAFVTRHTNMYNAILNLQAADLNQLLDNKLIDGFKFYALNDNLTKFCDHMGKSERIKTTVFPTTYNFYTKVFIGFLIISVTMVLDDLLGIISILFGFLVGYIFMTIQHMGQALLDPFEEIPTGISLNQITRTIEIDLLETLGETNIPSPIKSGEKSYVL